MTLNYTAAQKRHIVEGGLAIAVVSAAVVALVAFAVVAAVVGAIM